MISTWFVVGLILVVELTGEIMEDDVPAGHDTVCSELALALDFDLDLISDPDSRFVPSYINIGCGCDLADSEDELLK